MNILVDADSCPRSIRSIIIRAARRVGRTATFVADRELADCIGPYVEMAVVEPGADHADDRIVDMAHKGDLVVTRDVILASRVVEMECVAIDDRGSVYTTENIRERLSLRNAMAQFREAGFFVEKNKPIGAKEIQAFANALDSQLTKLIRDEQV